MSESLVYWNSKKNCWSIKHANGKVYAHARHVEMENVRFVVREGGRQRVIKRQQKEFHAFVRGTVIHIGEMDEEKLKKHCHWSLVKYDPYKAGHFYLYFAHTPTTPYPKIAEAKRVMLGCRSRKGVLKSEVLASG